MTATMTPQVFPDVRSAILAAFNTILAQHNFPQDRINKLQDPMLAFIDGGLSIQRLSEKQRKGLILDLRGTINGSDYAMLTIPKNPEGPTPELFIGICQGIQYRRPPPAVLADEWFPLMIDLIAANR